MSGRAIPEDLRPRCANCGEVVLWNRGLLIHDTGPESGWRSCDHRGEYGPQATEGVTPDPEET